MKLDNEQIQRILDSFSVGTLESFVHFGETPLLSDEKLELTIDFIKTTHGMYCLVGGLSAVTSSMYAEKNSEILMGEIAETIGLKNAEFVHTQQSQYVITHKYDYHFFLFRL